MGPRWCIGIGPILSWPSASLLFVSPIASFTVLHLNILPSISSFLIVLCVFLLFFIFLGVLSVLFVELVGAFPWIMVRSSFLSVKVYGSICRWFSVT